MRTALIIEDERSVNNAVRALLEREGWKVLQAFTTLQATEHAARGSSIDVLIADVVLPAGNGAAIARQMLQNRPDIFCVLTSGYALSELQERALLSEDLLQSRQMEFLPKPFTVRALLDVVERMAGRAA